MKKIAAIVIVLMSLVVLPASAADLSLGAQWWVLKDTRSIERGWLAQLAYRHDGFSAALFYGQPRWDANGSPYHWDHNTSKIEGMSVAYRFSYRFVFLEPAYTKFHRLIDSLSYQRMFLRAGLQTDIRDGVHVEGGAIIPISQRVVQWLGNLGEEVYNVHVAMSPRGKVGWFVAAETTGKVFVRMSYEYYDYDQSETITSPVTRTILPFNNRIWTTAAGVRF